MKIFSSKIWLPVLLAFSAVLHVVYLIQLQHTPYATFLMVDAEGYHLKALKLLKDGWLGEGIFFQAPLYPYFLALIYKVFGVSFLAVQIVQVFISLANIILIYFIGKNLFDEKTALLGAVLAVFYGPMAYYSGLLLKVTLSLFLGCLLLLILLRATRLATWWSYLIAGMCLGINITLRGNYFLMFPALIAWIAFAAPSKGAKIWGVGLFVLGTILALSPVTIRNYYLEKDFVPTTYDAGPSFYIGNHARATGFQAHVDGVRANPIYEEQDFRTVAEKSSGKKLKPSEVSAFWFRQSRDFIVQEPMMFIKLVLKKCFLIVNSQEIPDNYDYVFMKTLTPVLKIAIIPFGFLMACSVFAVYLYRWNTPAFWLVYIYSGIYAVSVIMFYVVSRFRLPVVPAMIPLAAFFILEGWKKILTLQGQRQCAFVGCALIILSLVFWPVKTGDPAASHMNIGFAYENRGLWQEAADHYKSAVNINPTFAQGHLRQAVAYRMMGKIDTAMSELQQALNIQPQLVDAHMELGLNYENMKLWEHSAFHYRAVVEISPGMALSHLRLGIAFRMMEKLDMALSELQMVVAIDPNLTEAYLEIGLVYMIKGMLDEAISAYEKGLSFRKHELPESHLNLGMAYFRKGLVEQAIKEHQIAIEIRPDFMEAHFNLGLLYSRNDDSVRSAYHYKKAEELQHGGNSENPGGSS
jgi:tetratricopeptide (TPR) repeat protein